MAFEQYKYQNDYNREHYARLSVQVPKEDKDIIEFHWRKKGFKSFNAYVNDLIRKDMHESDSSVSLNRVNQIGAVNSIKIGK